LTGRLDSAHAYHELEPFLTSEPDLFGNAEPSLAASEAAGVSESLVLIEPSELRFKARPPYEPGGPRKKRALFSIAGQPYDLPVTDFLVGPRLMRVDYGEYGQDEVGLSSERRTLMTASLGGEKRGRHWKLAAAFLSVP
jgi:hypothetical protein